MPFFTTILFLYTPPNRHTFSTAILFLYTPPNRHAVLSLYYFLKCHLTDTLSLITLAMLLYGATASTYPFALVSSVTARRVRLYKPNAQMHSGDLQQVKVKR